MAGLSSALDELTGDDLSSVCGPQLRDRLRGPVVAQSRLAAEVAPGGARRAGGRAPAGCGGPRLDAAAWGRRTPRSR
ncbi:hypothetical protein E4P41_10000 [Geodermatophilus sp. DF01-2]|uniref:hypothetical protein n=1 Tax=Geodermatophilus sp. DF01-2 TaxID=2559610 RepID=UPI00107362B9|nr:hypothetical protein [Geodermatophilus sp. DF01_2]TFV61240.1 hypothetical protein E4P41_10000 [Geodermatophilus sp. DF01_2]